VGHRQILHAHHDGVVDEKAMRDLRMSIDDMTEQLRGKDIFDVSQVAFAFVETNGSLSVYPKFEHRPVTNQDLNVRRPACDSPPAYHYQRRPNHSSGALLLQSERGLAEECAGQGKAARKDIFIMSCDRSAKYKIFQKESSK
jgi:uncharacterized membrane protein YcaP (DUF421 family)